MMRKKTVVLWYGVWLAVVLAVRGWSAVPWYVDFMYLENPEWGMEAAPLSRIFVSNGHFYNALGRVRFWGVNITGQNNFPLKVDAPRIARALRLMGVNMVRLHFMEHSWGESLLVSPEGEELDPKALDRLDYFLWRLGSEGIYVNMNLHVGRIFPEIPVADRGVFELGKIFGYIDDRLVESQKRFASRLLGRTNAYTRLPYTDDPVIAMIEVNNENALTGINPLHLSYLSSYYQDQIRTMWNVFLRSRYTNYAAWRSANWRENASPVFSLAQTNPRQRFHWRWENHAGGRSRLDWRGDVLHWTVSASGREAWHNQFMCAGLPLLSGSRYEMSFEARSAEGLPLSIHTMQNHAPWVGLGYYTNLQLSGEWQKYSMVFFVFSDETNARLNFSTRVGKTGGVEMRGFVLTQLAHFIFQIIPWKGVTLSLFLLSGNTDFCIR